MVCPVKIALEELKKRFGWIFLLCAAALIVSFCLGKFDFAMLFGVLSGTVWGCAEFLWMGCTVESALKRGAKKAASAMRTNYLARLAATGVDVYLSFNIPFINPAGFIISLFFPRISIYLNAIFRKGGRN